MVRYVLVLSDAHLAPLLSSAQMPYRSAAFAPDAALAQTIDRAVARRIREGGALEIVLAGDVFDFDAPLENCETTSCVRSVDVRTAPGAAQALRRILADHPSVLFALRRALAVGARVVILPGNHDAQLVFPEVREVLRGALRDEPSASLSARFASPLVATEVVFRSWSHVTADGLVVVEHGHQYDPLCTLSRLLPQDGRTESTVGTVSSFYGPLLFEGGDPFAIDPFAERRSVLRALASSLQRSGPAAILRCTRELMAASADCPSPSAWELLADEMRVGPRSARARHACFASKATVVDLLKAASREYDYGPDVEAALQRAMTVATDVHGAKVAVVGHTHAPRQVVLPNGAVMLNSGSWTPRRSPSDPVGTYAWIATDGQRVLSANVEAVRR